MNYKKTISVIIAVIMVFCNWITVIANAAPNGGSGLSGSSTPNNTTTLKLEVVQSGSDYTLDIPAEVTLTQGTTDITTATGTAQITLSVGPLLAPGMDAVKVTVMDFANSGNDTSEHWLINDAGDPIYYTAKVGATNIVAGEYSQNFPTVIVSAEQNQTVTSTIDFALLFPIHNTGVYKDTLTFSVGEVHVFASGGS